MHAVGRDRCHVLRGRKHTLDYMISAVLPDWRQLPPMKATRLTACTAYALTFTRCA